MIRRGYGLLFCSGVAMAISIAAGSDFALGFASCTVVLNGWILWDRIVEQADWRWYLQAMEQAGVR